MKLKVLKQFHDKVTGECYRVGSVIEPSDARGQEMLASPLILVERIDGAVAGEETAPSADAPAPRTKKRK